MPRLFLCPILWPGYLQYIRSSIIAGYFDNTGNIVYTARVNVYTIAMKLETAALILDKIGNPTRLRIVRLLVRAGDQGLAVGAIQKNLEIPGSTLTHHIAQLKYAGLIIQERHQATLYCKLQYDQLNEVIKYLTEECCSDEALIKDGKAA